MYGMVSTEELKSFVRQEGEKIKHQYEKCLLEKTAEEFLETKVDYYVFATIRLCDNTLLETHYRWSDPEEDLQGKELDTRYRPMEDYYEKHILGKKIIRISVGLDDNMDDECYVKAYVSETKYLAIPLGMNKFRYEFRKFLNSYGAKL